MSAKDYRDLFFIAAIDCSSQVEKLAGSPCNLNITFEIAEVPANNNDLSNPRDLEAFVLVLNEVRYSVNVIDKAVRKLN